MDLNLEQTCARAQQTLVWESKAWCPAGIDGGRLARLDTSVASVLVKEIVGLDMMENMAGGCILLQEKVHDEMTGGMVQW